MQRNVLNRNLKNAEEKQSNKLEKNRLIRKKRKSIGNRPYNEGIFSMFPVADCHHKIKDAVEVFQLKETAFTTL